MGWNIDEGMDVTSAFQGITTPLRELNDEIHQRGWDVSKVDIKDGQYAATCKNPTGQQVEKTGPDPQTAVAHCLVAIMRLETMRFPARIAAWQHTWEDKLPEIAQAYADAPTYDPKAASAWKELAEDSVNRAKAIADQIRVEFTADPVPYKDVNEMSDDIRNNQKIQVSKANLSHPLWSNEQALAYRLVHDVLGHAQVGGDWGWHGENGATAAHMPLLSPQAQRALFTEAIGQTAHNHFYRRLGPQKVVFLDDHLQASQDAENAAGHGGVHPSQTLVPTGIPSIEEKTSAADQEPWSWGNWGKGFIDAQTGEPVTWTTDSPLQYGDIRHPTEVGIGSPHHIDVAADRAKLELQEIDRDPSAHFHSPITIAPNGQYTSSNVLNTAGQDYGQEGAWRGEEPDGEEHRFEELHPALRQLDLPTWLKQNSGGNQMGHAPRLAGDLGDQLDPNDGWESGIEPLRDNAYLWQKEESGKDPLDFQGVKDQAHQIDSGWFNLHHHDGGPDLDSQRQAVVNAFRSVLLSPRQDPRWRATHYQHIHGLPASVSDPLRYADVLDVQREAHNQARGLPKGIHNQLWAAESKSLKQWIKGMNPELDDAQVAERARRELFHMIAEEEARITAEDSSGDLSPMEVTEAVNKSLKKRLAVITKSNVDQKFDFGNERLFHKAFNAPDPGVYGSYLNSHLRPIGGVSLNADAILSAARDDVTHHGGKGHRFRAKVMDLVPGIGPAEISHAWSLLQPHTSQLGIINPSIAEALGYAPEKPSNRDYFKMERELAAGRDAAGYTHVPLGQFSKGLYDLKSYGHGVHQDERPFAINPVPYDQIDWRQIPNQPTATWDKPYWWESTKPQREEIGKQWDRMVAVNNPAHKIPYRTAGMTGMQRQRMIEQWDQHQPDNSEVIHTFPNGYTIRKLNTWGDKRREGQLMRNCWAYPLTKDGEDPIDTNPIDQEWPTYDHHYSLRDEYNYPHVSFFFQPGEGLNMARNFFGHGNAMVSPQYKEMIKEWAKANNTHINPGEWRGTREPEPIDIREAAIPLAPLRRPYITHPENGEIIEGEPNLSLMQHAKDTLGLTTEQIWAMDPEIGRTTDVSDTEVIGRPSPTQQSTSQRQGK